MDCFGCENFAYCPASDEIAYAGKGGVVKKLSDWVSCGDEADNKDDKKLWKKICRKKIKQVYKEYMKIKKEK